ncbi:MFS family permease [Paraburkholderia sp. GAS199]|uniref:MFS transporter n=1 Tax=Paraburkholderia sp. GAS199 TaxID=3035126 RepID=UPI003D1A9B08
MENPGRLTIPPYVTPTSIQFTQWISWRWIFLLNIPICAILGVCVFFRIRDSRNKEAGPVDLIGSLFFGAGLSVCMWAFIAAPVDGWGSLATLIRIAVGVALLMAVYWAERLQRSPMINLSLFRQPRFVAAVLSMFGYAACAQVMMTFLPLYLQTGFSLSAVQAGLGMLPFALAMIAGPYLGATLGGWLSTYSILSVGLALVGIGNLLTALAASLNRYGLFAVGMLLTGIGAGTLNGNTQKAIVSCVPPTRTGMASGISTTTRFTGIVASVAVIGAVLVSRTRSSFDSHPAALLALNGVDERSFLSQVLAGDLEHAAKPFGTPLKAILVSAARESFDAGFAWSLSIVGILAIAIPVLVYSLSRVTSAIEPDATADYAGAGKRIGYDGSVSE